MLAAPGRLFVARALRQTNARCRSLQASLAVPDGFCASGYSPPPFSGQLQA